MNRIKDYLEENISITLALKYKYSLEWKNFSNNPFEFYKKYCKSCGIRNEIKNKTYKFGFSNGKYTPISVSDLRLFRNIIFINLCHSFNIFSEYRRDYKFDMRLSKYRISKYKE